MVGNKVETMKTEITWDEVRALWVCGEGEEVRKLVANASRTALMRLVVEALKTAQRLDYQSGDLVDLREILAAQMTP